MSVRPPLPGSTFYAQPNKTDVENKLTYQMLLQENKDLRTDIEVLRDISNNWVIQTCAWAASSTNCTATSRLRTTSTHIWPARSAASTTPSRMSPPCSSTCPSSTRSSRPTTIKSRSSRRPSRTPPPSSSSSNASMTNCFKKIAVSSKNLKKRHSNDCLMQTTGWVLSV